MKRIVTLLLAAGLVMGAYTGAQAADVKVSGKWNFGFHFMSDVDHNHGSEDDFDASQRLRLQLNIIASEDLQGVVFFEIGNQTWGQADQGGALGADGVVVEVKRSYIDWVIPETDAQVRMGIQGLTLPGAMGNALFDEDVAAIAVSNAFNDNFALTAFWARPFDGISHEFGVDYNGEEAPLKDEMDMFGLVAPITFDGHAITPYFVYASIGENVDSDYTAEYDTKDDIFIWKLSENVDAYYFGVAYAMTAFDPFTLDVSFLYGSAEGKSSEVDQEGWMVDFKAAYALDFMTPAVIGWYASGDDKNDQGRLPVFGGGCWYPTSFGYVGSCYQEDSHIGDNPNGTWAIGLELADISFMEDLSHVFRFVYIEGNNEPANDDGEQFGNSPLVEGTYLTDHDSAIEINFDSKYDIYENLAFILELGMIDYHLANDKNEETAYKATFNFVYSF